jgi:hypothetical protein
MFSPLLNTLWVTAAVLKVTMAVLLTTKKFYRRFPIFYAYAVYSTALTTSLFAARISYPAYFYTFWVGRILDVVLEFAVIYEIFAKLFADYDALRRITSVLFKWTAAALLLVATLLATAPSADASRLISTILIAERSIAVIQTGLLVFLFIFASSFGISWRHYLFGISAGFGVLGTIKLADLSIRTQIGGSANNIFNVVQIAGYIVAAGIWLSYLVAREPESPRVTSMPSTNLEAWNHALRQVLER